MKKLTPKQQKKLSLSELAAYHAEICKKDNYKTKSEELSTMTIAEKKYILSIYSKSEELSQLIQDDLLTWASDKQLSNHDKNVMCEIIVNRLLKV
jgi:hypothetical protein